MARYPDSRIIGDYDTDGFDDGLGDLIGDDDGLGDLIGDAELGLRRRQRHRLQALARRSGQVMIPREQAAQMRQAARVDSLRAANMQALSSGDAGTAGHFVADGGEREFYMPFQAAVLCAAAANSGATLSVVVQRPMMVKRIILDSLDIVTLADSLNTIGVTGILNGVQPIFNAQGVAPARAFAFNAVGNHLKTSVLRVGNVLSATLTRMVAGKKPSVDLGLCDRRFRRALIPMRLPFAIIGYARDREDVQAAIDAATRLGELQIRKRYAPLWWDSPARYRREQHETLPGVERIALPEELHAMGAGDCDDHAPMLAASLRAIGREARAVVIESPGIGYHVIVRTRNARGEPIVLDPSARRGMLDGETIGARERRGGRRFMATMQRAGSILDRVATLNPASAAARALTQEAARLVQSARETVARSTDDDGDDGDDDSARDAPEERT